MSMDGQRTKRPSKIAENFNRQSKVPERYRRRTDRETDDGTAIAYSEREREFTFAKNGSRDVTTPISWTVSYL